jgi:hypothetical protein
VEVDEGSSVREGDGVRLGRGVTVCVAEETLVGVFVGGWKGVRVACSTMVTVAV